MIATVLAAFAFAPAISQEPEPPRILVFTKTAGFRHDSIPEARAAVRRIGATEGWDTVITEDSGWFTAERLAPFDAVVFLLTTGDVLDEGQETAFEGFVRGGGGFVGVHSASDTEYDWAFYGRLVGAYFKSHPAIQPARVRIAAKDDPTVGFLPDPWERTDEWYCFRANPRGEVDVLATVDESTYEGGTMGADHPVVWSHTHFAGRAWYTAMGHTKESYAEPLFLRHLTEGIRWALRRR